MRPALLKLLCLQILLIGSPVAAVTFTLNGAGESRVLALAYSGTESAGSAAYPTTVPTSGAPSTGMVDASSSTTTYDLSNTSFDVGFDHLRGTTFRDIAQSQELIYFSPSADVDYVLTGAYSSDGAEADEFYLFVVLNDLTTADRVLQEEHLSYSTAGESFVLGQAGGDAIDYLLGSLTGTLIGGHEYQLVVNSHVRQDGGVTSAAHATGYVSLAFVPEPGTGLLVIAGLLGLAGWRRARAE